MQQDYLLMQRSDGLESHLQALGFLPQNQAARLRLDLGRDRRRVLVEGDGPIDVAALAM